MFVVVIRVSLIIKFKMQNVKFLLMKHIVVIAAVDFKVKFK